MNLAVQIAQELGLKKEAVKQAIILFDDKNTVPFVARYRKEQTQGLEDESLRQIEERLHYLRQLEEKKGSVLDQLAKQGVEDAELISKIKQAASLVELEDHYRPYRPKRKTRASQALERGLGPLAQVMLDKLEGDKTAVLSAYVDADKGLDSLDEVRRGAMDILAERFTDDPDIRGKARRWSFNQGSLRTEKDLEEEVRSPYEIYYAFEKDLSKLVPHQVLAINRGEKEGFLAVHLSLPDLAIMEAILKKNLSRPVLFLDEVKESILDGYKRLLRPALERDIRKTLTEKAEDHAIEVFADNVGRLLMQAPVKNTRIIGYDPAFRTGCKLACLDEEGQVLATDVIYPVKPHQQVKKSRQVLLKLIKDHRMQAVSLGNGTACRENELFLQELIETEAPQLTYTITNEAGASVYSASKKAKEEFPHLDVTLRSAVSIGRRVIDPLAELVKIEAKAIGVGQYQHDVDQKKLGRALDGVVEDCVNRVGVNVNTASEELLIQVSGLTKSTAKNLLAQRAEAGSFASRADIKKVRGIGPKAFEQAAGFLRIVGGKDPLDNTGVHPEAYGPTRKLLKDQGLEVGDLEAFKALDPGQVARDYDLGLETAADILKELMKPGRDPREALAKPLFKQGVIDLKDLEEGMILSGVVRNVVDFGAFVDIGVHQDGLVHISEMSDHFVKSALGQVFIGDEVSVRVLAIDRERERISLSMKGLDMKEEKKEAAPQGPLGGKND